jgi:hypothetical protein
MHVWSSNQPCIFLNDPISTCTCTHPRPCWVFLSFFRLPFARSFLLVLRGPFRLREPFSISPHEGCLGDRATSEVARQGLRLRGRLCVASITTRCCLGPAVPGLEFAEIRLGPALRGFHRQAIFFVVTRVNHSGLGIPIGPDDFDLA